jgi:hypothetical protein
MCITFLLNHTITNEISNLLMIGVHILFITTELKIATFYLTTEVKNTSEIGTCKLRNNIYINK